MNEPPKPRWGPSQWGVVMLVVSLGCLLAAAMMPITSKNMSEMKGVNNCRQIILSLKLYSKDNGAAYPDAGPIADSVKSANQVFRRLFEEEVVSDEHIFGCPPRSLFVPDGDIGTAPDFAQTLTPGECHWMLLKFQTDTSNGDMPVVVENALNATWPPKWDVSDQSGNKRGGCGKGIKSSLVAMMALSPWKN